MRVGLAGRIAHAFLDSKLTPVAIVASLGLGALALWITPREEEPQIRVPMIDVAVAWPGADPAEVEARVVEPIERAMWGLAGVEHVDATAAVGRALVTVRFEVGQSEETSLVKVYERLSALGAMQPGGLLPPGASAPAVELYSIDDVPFQALTLWSATLSSDDLRPLAQELARDLAELPEIASVQVTGGASRVVRIEPDPDRLAASGVSWATLVGALRSGGARASAGSTVRADRETAIEVPTRFVGVRDVARAVVGLRGGRPVYVGDVARIVDGPDERKDVVLFAPGPSRPGARPDGQEFPAVTIALAKRPGANATQLAQAVLAKLELLRPRLIPAEVQIDVTRDYGVTAANKSAELVEHLLIATLSVAALIALAMGWRAGLVVLVAVPVTLSLTLFVFNVLGYTLNRVTLFALIFSIGILVDDAIVVVENIERHRREKPGQPFWRTAVEAVDEVGNPTVLATFTVIAAILPMAFVRGLMGPYMLPIPTGASAAMLFSLAVAFIVSPWAALRVFAKAELHGAAEEARPEGWSTRLYRRVMGALIGKPRARLAFFGGLLALLLGAVALVPLGAVKVKMLPFDDKSEFQVLVDHDEGTPLETTLETARRIARALLELPEVKDVQVYAGAPAPFNFNGLVRHYFLRRAAHGADLQVNLAGKHDRKRQSHEIAVAVRPRLTEIARARGARVKVIEIPPGPPVLDTLVAEIYGPNATAREQLAGQVRELFEATSGVVDIDDSIEAAHTRVELRIDRERAGLLGVPVTAVVDALASSGAGVDAALLEATNSREAVPVRVRLSENDRASLERRLSVRLEAPGGAVALRELVRVETRPAPQPIHHKDLKPLVYVLADLAGARESPVYALGELNARLDQLRLPDGSRVERHATEAPVTSDRPSLKWDGEWQITYEVFRDLGLAFAVVLVLIAILVTGWFQSYSVPLAILLPIPLSLVGILPGHGLFGAFFTATSMIGFIAGAGIIVRNSIILVDFIELRLRQGEALESAVVEAGVVRFRPMLLTAAAVVVGSLVILFDPIFQGLAISLMMGEVAATLLSRLAVPVVYYLLARRGRAELLRQEGLTPELAG